MDEKISFVVKLKIPCWKGKSSSDGNARIINAFKFLSFPNESYCCRPLEYRPACTFVGDVRVIELIFNSL